MDEELAPTERTLEELEAVIDRGVQVAEQAAPFLIDMAVAAGEIRERELYKASHRSFAAYCEDRWGWDKSKTMRMLAWSRELPSGTETTDQVARATSSEVEPPMSQRVALKARKQRAIEAKASDDPGQKDRGQSEPQATLLQPTKDAELAEAHQKIQRLEAALDVRTKPTALQSELEGLRVENELLRLELERPREAPVVAVVAPEGDFMKEMAAALGLAEESPPATMLAKARALMAERGKKPASKKKAEPKAEPKLATVTQIKGRCAIHPKGSIRVTTLGKFCEECQTLVRPMEKVG
jgi:hypothetical protein